MPLLNDRQLQMRVNEHFVRQIDDWRRQQPDLPSRSEAIRRLVELGLQASAGTAAPPAKPQPRR